MVVLLPMLAYVLSIPASLIAYITTGNLSTASGVLGAGLNASMWLGIALFFILIVVGAVRPIKNAPKVGLRHMFVFYALFIFSVLALFEVAVYVKQHALYTPQVALALSTFLGLTWSLITPSLVVAGLFLHNHLVSHGDEFRRYAPRASPQVLRGLLAVLIVVPAASVAFAYSITKSALDAGFISLTAMVITMVIIFAIMYRKMKKRHK